MKDQLAARLACALLSVLLASCGTTRHAAPTDAKELARFVLIIREGPGRKVSYLWQPSEGVDLSPYQYRFSAPAPAGSIMTAAAGRQRDCEAENDACYNECFTRPLASGFGHITSNGRKKGGKAEYCRDRCRQPYLDCMELQESKPREFTAINDAMDWLGNNRDALLVGGVVVIAGVTFVVVSVGVGILVLAPLVLLTASENVAEPRSVAVSR